MKANKLQGLSIFIWFLVFALYSEIQCAESVPLDSSSNIQNLSYLTESSASEECSLPLPVHPQEPKEKSWQEKSWRECIEPFVVPILTIGAAAAVGACYLLSGSSSNVTALQPTGADGTALSLRPYSNNPDLLFPRAYPNYARLESASVLPLDGNLALIRSNNIDVCSRWYANSTRPEYGISSQSMENLLATLDNGRSSYFNAIVASIKYKKNLNKKIHKKKLLLEEVQDAESGNKILCIRSMEGKVEEEFLEGYFQFFQQFLGPTAVCLLTVYGAIKGFKELEETAEWVIERVRNKELKLDPVGLPEQSSDGSYHQRFLIHGISSLNGCYKRLPIELEHVKFKHNIPKNKSSHIVNMFVSYEENRYLVEKGYHLPTSYIPHEHRILPTLQEDTRILQININPRFGLFQEMFENELANCDLNLMAELPKNGKPLEKKMYLEWGSNKLKYKFLDPHNKMIEGILEMSRKPDLTTKIEDKIKIIKAKMLKEAAKNGHALLVGNISLMREGWSHDDSNHRSYKRYVGVILPTKKQVKNFWFIKQIIPLDALKKLILFYCQINNKVGIDESVQHTRTSWCKLKLLSELPKDGKPSKDTMYLEKSGNKLKYKVLDPVNKIVEDLLDIQIEKELTSGILNSLKPEILEETSKRGHTGISFSPIGNPDTTHGYPIGCLIRQMFKITEYYMRPDQTKYDYIIEESLKLMSEHVGFHHNLAQSVSNQTVNVFL